MELNENTTVEQPIQEEIKELMNELKNNNLNGNEIIQVLKAENAELKASLKEIYNDLLEMLTRGDSGVQDDKPTEPSNTAV